MGSGQVEGPIEGFFTEGKLDKIYLIDGDESAATESLLGRDSTSEVAPGGKRRRELF